MDEAGRATQADSPHHQDDITPFASPPRPGPDHHHHHHHHHYHQFPRHLSSHPPFLLQNTKNNSTKDLLVTQYPQTANLKRHTP
ncbi:hypothetical protein BO82DRAFT_357220 [Aspergillus uvarum CBS 121591]|uniref:Uncharacterized protein n=1 Tax=Aspergillus uvarum CBS 121591 TaxID=1448315 RepID=A0A319C3S0_9EURO|nr:hypothetical protein BO82DRAFT_357220 [Aspergillus uvarum CBS 121591]PYH78499.1 hypothetical protein BO82DRAFT_357220 [Aspergillus uvarum CBS 121591]